MEKIYESSTLMSAAKERVNAYEELEQQLSTLKQTLQGMADLGDDFQGQGADNIKAFYRRHVDVVTLWQDVIGNYKHFFQNMDEQADQANLSGNTVVTVPFVEQDVTNSLQRSKDMVAQQHEALQGIFHSISDLVPLSVFSKEAFDEQMDHAEKKRRETVEAVEQLDANWVAEYTGLEPLFMVLQAHVQSLLQESSQGGTTYQMAFDEQAYKASELYSVQKALHEQSLQYVDYKKQEKDVYELEKQAEIEANKPWYEKSWDAVTTFTGEITGYYDYKRATEGIDPITGAKLSTSQRTTAGAMAAAGFIPIIGWAGRAFKGGKAIYSTAKGVNAANHALDAYKTTQGFNILGKAEKGLYGLVLTNGLYEYTTGKDMFGNTISDEQRQASLFQSLGIAGAGALSSRYARQVGEAGAKAVAKGSQKLSDMRNVLSTYAVQRVMKPLQQSAQRTYRSAADYVKKSFNKLGDTPVPVRVRVFQTVGNSQMGFGFETVTLKDGVRYIEKSVGKGAGNTVSNYLDDIVEAGSVNATKMNKLKNAIQNNTFSVDELSEIRKKMSDLGITKEYDESLIKMDFGKYLRGLIGDPPSAMINPHAHHILFKKGLGQKQQELVREGQEILRSYGIDPIIGEENLVWAPNAVVGQHSLDALELVVNRLKAIEEMGGDFDDIVEALEDLGDIASTR
ncbi:T7SS effector LXG polymorphic toxin [Metabacillus iocasae]|uniref:Ribonuclease toxin of YeeF-YezG toxin-antitoxin module n=1 Tax=Priestia iocasae TaxID=2291674 RepID=A0ABS2QTC2_9BACI|nr:T7SS effector LXG polymorphic toxin [Metabacillus iocasae]MBM7702277.1 putative ribonuclease toxin of YeeF-YezG toxin-antitoxin module [Metabacillus iocasae]